MNCHILQCYLVCGLIEEKVTYYIKLFFILFAHDVLTVDNKVHAYSSFR